MQKHSNSTRIVSLLLAFLLLFQQSGIAQTLPALDISSHFAGLGKSLDQNTFRPLHLRYLGYRSQDNSLKLLIDKGDFFRRSSFVISDSLKDKYQNKGKNLLSPSLSDSPSSLSGSSSSLPGSSMSLSGLTGQSSPDDNTRLQSETSKLLNYLLIGLSLPNSSFWVNLRPDSPDNIIDNELAKTDIGKIMLEADLQLKKDTALLTSPNTPQGKLYWDKLYKKAEELFGCQNITIPTLTRPWIVPGEIIIREAQDNAYIYKATVKVMLEEDYLSQTLNSKPETLNKLKTRNSKAQNQQDKLKQLNSYSSALLKELVLPELNKRVNSSKDYAPLRQAYYSLILAQWFKERNRKPEYRNQNKSKDRNLAQLINSQDLTGLTSKEPWSIHTYFQQYQKSFKEGEYNLKEPVRTPFGQVIRSYFSGGVSFGSEIVKAVSSGMIQGNKNIDFIAAVSNGGFSVNNYLISGTFGDGNLEIENIISSSAIDAKKEGFWQAIVRKGKNLRVRDVAIPGEDIDAKIVRKSLAAFEYTDVSQDFCGVDLEHFVCALNRLANQNLSADILKQLLTALNLKASDSYDRIYEEFAKGKINKKIIDLINADKYSDPRLNLVIIDQNSNPKAQSIYEAISNSLDALGFKIGQFGKGVKQIIDWLEPTGEDRIDIFTKQLHNSAYQFTILKTRQGQNYIQIRTITEEAFQAITGQSLSQGTMVRVTVKTPIPRADKQFQTNSQESIVQGIHKRFPYVSAVKITTQIGEEPVQKVNGFETKQVIVPAKTIQAQAQEPGDKLIQVKLTKQGITIIDNGRGMDAETISQMFVPRSTKKFSEPLGSQAAKQELKKVKLVQDTSLAQRVSFSRNSEVIFTADIPADICPGAVSTGGLMLEFGSLLDVPESRDSIIIPLDLKPGEISNFQLAVEYVINQLVNYSGLALTERIKYINTIILGLEGLIQGNENYSWVVRNIRDNTKRSLREIILELKKQGYVILPYEKCFEQIAIPADKQGAVFVNQYLFDWQGAVSLLEIGGRVIPGINLSGENQIPLVAILFTAESIEPSIKYDRGWQEWEENQRHPQIKTDRFIALPLNYPGIQRLLDLAEKRFKQGLSQDEDEEFMSLAQRVKIITDEEVVTSYQIASPKETMRLERQEFKFTQSKGEIDSDAINGFLVNPPVISGLGDSVDNPEQTPADANQRAALLENGDIIEIGTGKKYFDNVESMEYVSNGYYKVRLRPEGNSGAFESLVKFYPKGVWKTEEHERIKHANIIISPDKRFAYVQRYGGSVEVEEVFDLINEQRYYFKLDFSTSDDIPMPTGVQTFSRLQFSKDGKYLVCFEKDILGKNALVIVEIFPEPVQEDLKKQGGVQKQIPLGYGDFEYSISPFANVAYVRNNKTQTMTLIDLSDAEIVAKDAKYLHTDSTGAYTVIIDQAGEMSIYVHKARKLLLAKDFGADEIIGVVTKWKDGKAYYEIMSKSNWCYFTEEGEIYTTEEIKQDYFEEINAGGQVRVWSNIIQHTQDISLAQIIPPRGLASLQPTAFKHPRFELFIDNSDAEHPVAIDPKTGDKFPFKGEILTYDSQEKRLDFYEGSLLFYTEANKGSGEKIPFGCRAVVDNSKPANFVVYSLGISGKGFYRIWDISKRELFTLRKDVELSREYYSDICFDGKYFVFTNPKTGDAVYLDPHRPKEPVFVPANQAPAQIFSDTKPQDAGDRFVIRQDGAGYCIFDTELNKRNYELKKVEKINSGTFIVWDFNNRCFILKAKPGELVEVFRLAAGEKVVSCTDRAVIVEAEAGHKYVVDVINERRIEGRGASDRIDFSASGTFSVHKDSERISSFNLDFFDHAAGYKIICRTDDVQEYLVHPDADVVILKHQDGKYGVFRLDSGKMLLEDAEHIEIDSTGTFAIVKRENSLSYVNLKTGSAKPVITSNIIEVACDKKYIYVVVWHHEGVQIEVCDKYGGPINFMNAKNIYQFAQDELPRFWERYDLEKKQIWDRKRNNRTIDIPSIYYAVNPPTMPVSYAKLSGKACIMDKQADGRLSSVEDLGAKTDAVVLRYHLRLNEYCFAPMQYEKTLYGYNRAERDNIVFASSHCFSRGWINSTKTFILGVDRLNLQKVVLINAEGSIIELTQLVPPGFVPTDVIADYFVFCNPQTGEIKYLDPCLVNFSAEIQNKQIDIERQKQALKIWNNQVIPQRDAFISRARDGYKEFLELIPEEFKASVREKLSLEISQLYQEQEQEIRKRFQSALDSRQQQIELTGLAFDFFVSRMSQFVSLLKRYLHTHQRVIAQEKYGVQRDFYINLFARLFELGRNFRLSLPAADENFLEVLANAWDIASQEQVDMISLISELAVHLKTASHYCITLAEMGRLVKFLSAFVSSDPLKNSAIVRKQLNRILETKPEVRNLFLNKLRSAFADIELELLIDYLAHPQKLQQLKQAKEFAFFLTNDVEQVQEKENPILPGQELELPEAGIEISQLMQLEQMRHKTGPDDIVMDMEYLISHLDRLSKRSDTDEAEMLKNITVQRESGAYTAEIAQNSKDATKDRKGELVVEFYLQKNRLGELEYVEQAADNGTGALQETALLIPVSTKVKSGQRDITGFFGTGKYTIFEGVDRLEIINKNDKQAYLFVFRVIKDDSGKPTAVKLTNIRKLDDSSLEQGVTVRRIKQMDNTIPALDQMLSQRQWRTFTALAQDENFKVSIIDHQGNKRPLNAEKEVLSEADFIGGQKQVNSGKFRIISVQDLASQVIDRAGLRVSEIPEKYLELIPKELRRYIRELGIVIQIPLPLIRNRSGFEHENEYLPVIQKYTAIEFYKAIAYKTLIQHTPQFVFPGLADDWETNDDRGYWDAVVEDEQIKALAELMNNADYTRIQPQELKDILSDERFVKILLLMQVAIDRARPGERTSLFLRRLAIQQERDRKQAELIAERMKKSGFTLGKTPELSEIPYSEEKISQAKSIETGHRQMAGVGKEGGIKIIDPSEYSPGEKKFMHAAFAIAMNFGIEQVYLISEKAAFSGLFRSFLGRHTMFLNRSRAAVLGKENIEERKFDPATNTIIHELGHLLEKQGNRKKIESLQLWQEGFIDHSINFTHQAVGRFAEAMKYAAAVSLANYESAGHQLILPKQSASSGIRHSEPAPGKEESHPLLDSSPDKGHRGQNDRMGGMQPSSDTDLGGVDFTAMPTVAQGGVAGMGQVHLSSSSSGLIGGSTGRSRLDCPVNLSSDLIGGSGNDGGQEWRQMERMIKAGIVPSPERIRERLVSSSISSQEEFKEELKQAIVFIAAIMRLEEVQTSRTDSSLEEILRAVESGSSADEMRLALTQIPIPAPK